MNPTRANGPALPFLRVSGLKLLQIWIALKKVLIREGVKFLLKSTVLKLAPKNIHFLHIQPLNKAQGRVNGAKQYSIQRANIRRTKRYIARCLETPENLSKSDRKGPFHRRHQNLTAMQLLNGCSYLDEIFCGGTYFLTVNTMLVAASLASEPFGTECGYRTQKICKKQKIIFEGL